MNTEGIHSLESPVPEPRSKVRGAPRAEVTHETQLAEHVFRDRKPVAARSAPRAPAPPAPQPRSSRAPATPVRDLSATGIDPVPPRFTTPRRASPPPRPPTPPPPRRQAPPEQTLLLQPGAATHRDADEWNPWPETAELAFAGSLHAPSQFHEPVRSPHGPHLDTGELPAISRPVGLPAPLELWGQPEPPSDAPMPAPRGFLGLDPTTWVLGLAALFVSGLLTGGTAALVLFALALE